MALVTTLEKASQSHIVVIAGIAHLVGEIGWEEGSMTITCISMVDGAERVLDIENPDDLLVCDDSLWIRGTEVFDTDADAEQAMKGGARRWQRQGNGELPNLDEIKGKGKK